MNKAVWIGAAGGAVVLLALWLWLPSGPQNPASVPVGSGRPAAPAPSPAPGTMTAPEFPVAAPPAPPARIDTTPGRPGAPSLASIQQRLLAMTADGRQPSPMEVDAALADLQRNQGKNVIAGVDISVMRENLARAERLRVMAEEMQVLAQNPNKENLARIQSLMAEIQRVQAGIIPQVAVPQAAPR